jgi:hypothetical protein
VVVLGRNPNWKRGRSEVRVALSVASGGFGEEPLTLEEKAAKATGACDKPCSAYSVLRCDECYGVEELS